MSYNYLVRYGYEKLDAAELPEDQRWGFGTIPINTDVVPQTEEEFQEIARTIGHTAGYEKVAILSIEDKNPTTLEIDDSDEVLEGEIVDQ